MTSEDDRTEFGRAVSQLQHQFPEAVRELQQRFPQISLKRIADTFESSNGHTGRTAAALRTLMHENGSRASVPSVVGFNRCAQLLSPGSPPKEQARAATAAASPGAEAGWEVARLVGRGGEQLPEAVGWPIRPARPARAPGPGGCLGRSPGSASSQIVEEGDDSCPSSAGHGALAEEIEKFVEAEGLVTSWVAAGGVGGRLPTLRRPEAPPPPVLVSKPKAPASRGGTDLMLPGYQGGEAPLFGLAAASGNASSSSQAHRSDELNSNRAAEWGHQMLVVAESLTSLLTDAMARQATWPTSPQPPAEEVGNDLVTHIDVTCQIDEGEVNDAKIFLDGGVLRLVDRKGLVELAMATRGLHVDIEEREVIITMDHIPKITVICDSVEHARAWCNFLVAEGAKAPAGRMLQWAAAAATATPAAEEIIITLDKSNGAMFGIEVSEDDLVISTISAGLVEDWNLAQGAGQQVQCGDKIVEVNSLTDPQEMLKELQSNRASAIKFQREQAPAAAAASPPPLPPRGAGNTATAAVATTSRAAAAAQATWATTRDNGQESHAALLANNAQHDAKIDAMNAKLMAAHTNLRKIVQLQGEKVRQISEFALASSKPHCPSSGEVSAEETVETQLQRYLLADGELRMRIDEIASHAQDCESRLEVLEKANGASAAMASVEEQRSKFGRRTDELVSRLQAYERWYEDWDYRSEEVMGQLRKERAGREEDQIVHTEFVKALKVEKEELQREVTNQKEQTLREKSRGKMAIDEVHRLLRILADNEIPVDSRYKYL